MVHGWYTSMQSQAPEIAKLTYNLIDKDLGGTEYSNLYPLVN